MTLNPHLEMISNSKNSVELLRTILICILHFEPINMLEEI